MKQRWKREQERRGIGLLRECQDERTKRKMRLTGWEYMKEDGEERGSRTGSEKYKSKWIGN